MEAFAEELAMEEEDEGDVESPFPAGETEDGVSEALELGDGV